MNLNLLFSQLRTFRSLELQKSREKFDENVNSNDNNIEITNILKTEPTADVKSYTINELKSIGFSNLEIDTYFQRQNAIDFSLGSSTMKYVLKPGPYNIGNNSVTVSTPQELYDIIHKNDTTQEDLSKRSNFQDLQKFGFTKDEVDKYFDFKTVINKKGNFIASSMQYVLKEGLTIDGKSITSVKDLMLALNKTNYVTNVINKYVEQYADGNEKLKSDLLTQANTYFNDYNGSMGSFEYNLSEHLKTFAQTWDEWKGDYSEYKLIDHENFAEEFKSGRMPFEEAVRILKESGANVTLAYNEKIETGTSRFEKITYEIDGQTYSVSRTIKPKELTDEADVSDEVKEIAQKFKQGKLMPNETIEKLKALGAENFMTYMCCSRGFDSRSICFDLNGVFYQIKADLRINNNKY